ncbi:hypothetical protein AgCh_000437 [Apium graveolens]
MSKKHSKMKIGSRLCKKNSINSNDVMFGNLSSHQRMLQSLVQNGFSRIKWMNLVLLLEIKQGSWHKGTTNKKALIFDQIYAPVARLESIRMLLAYACYKKIKLHQMDVKSAFLNGFLEEKVYVKQPPGFEHEQHPDYVYKLKKALYGLKQTPRACEFDMTMMGELNYFLGLQIKQSKDDIYVHQSKYVKNLLTRFGFDNVKPNSTPMNQNSKLTSNEKGKDVDIKKYRGMLDSSLYLTSSRPEIMYSTLRDFGIKCVKVPIYCDNTSTINISKNPVNHSRTKHIDVRHHFLRDNATKGGFRHNREVLGTSCGELSKKSAKSEARSGIFQKVCRRPPGDCKRPPGEQAPA